jgi:radical SAM protein with 4Fe4S-binding SPASM domain
MPFCYAPWSNIDISPRGNISPCCKFQHEQYNYPRHNIITSDLNEYTNSELLKEIKQDFVNDVWPRGCERCRIEEENSIESKRQLDYDRWKEQYNEYEIEKGGYLTASVAFGNTCNLKCITCGPSSSSRWYKEYKLIYTDSVKPNHFYKENFVEDFTSQCNNLIHLDIPGGEPLLSGVEQQKQLLEYYISSDQAKNITLHYTTNVTEYPDSEWWELWQHFKEIDMQLSIDGVDDRYEYIRYPASWNNCNINVERYLQAEKNLNNFRISVSHTLSAFNIYYLDEFFTWCEFKGLPRPWIGRVHTPEFFRISVYPKAIKDAIIKNLLTSKLDDIHVWSNLLENSDDSKFFNEFITRVEQHDRYRQTQFEKTFPEIAELIAKLQR